MLIQQYTPLYIQFILWFLLRSNVRCCSSFCTISITSSGPVRLPGALINPWMACFLIALLRECSWIIWWVSICEGVVFKRWLVCFTKQTTQELRMKDILVLALVTLSSNGGNYFCTYEHEPVYLPSLASTWSPFLNCNSSGLSFTVTFTPQTFQQHTERQNTESDVSFFCNVSRNNGNVALHRKSGEGWDIHLFEANVR